MKTTTRRLIQATIGARCEYALHLRYLMIKADLFGPSREIQKRKIFIHIPKAAGSSIARTGVARTPGHKTLRYYEKWLGNPKDLDTFAIVRNPYTRYLSAFNYLKRGGGNLLDERWATRIGLRNYDPNTFAVKMLSSPRVLRWMHFRPQVEFVRASDGSIGVQDILHFETLNKEWEDFANENRLVSELPNEKVFGKSDPFSLSPIARAHVRTVYEEDFLTFGYPS